MRFRISGLVVAMALSAVAISARPSAARCDAQGADAVDVAAARAAVALNCDCTGSANHGAYVSCASQQAQLVLVNKSCKGAVVKCAAKSTCGKAGFVTCCRTKSNGSTKCSTKSGATKCVAPKGGSACVGSHPSCCDACTSGGCASSPSSAFLEGSF